MKRWSDRVPARTRRIGLASMALTSDCWSRLVTAAPRDALHVRDRSHRQEIVPECRTINAHHSERLTGHRQDDDRPRLGVRRSAYSYLIATSGSTRAARRAGRKAATNAAPTKTAIEVTLVTGSCAVTPKSITDTSFDAIQAIGRPITRPSATIRPASYRISRSTCDCRAPSAIRTPISPVRRATLKASTPYSPTAANDSASTPKILA